MAKEKGVAGTARVTAGAERRELVSLPAFTGREAEVAALGRALARPPAVALIEGEAGIGKTRLVRECLARPALAGLHALVAACPPLRQPCTLSPLVDALRRATTSPRELEMSLLAGTLRPWFPEWAADLPPAPEPAYDATAARYRLFRALAELLARLQVAVLVVEDVHWADEATMEFLLFLSSQDRARPSVVVTYRPEEVAPDSLLLRLSSRVSHGSAGIRLSLDALDAVQTTRLVSSMLDGKPLSADLAAFLHQRTDGIPLAVEELTRLMNDRADLALRRGEWVRRSLEEIAVPASIRDGVLERAGRLGADARTVLEAAAVLAYPAAERTLRSVSGLTAARTRTALAELAASGLLTSGRGELASFRHVLAERAVYEAVAAPRRQLLHRRAGRLLERQSPQPIAQLTRHYREAAEPEKWCAYAERAADLALAAGDEATAAVLIHDLLTSATLSAEVVLRVGKKAPFASIPGIRLDGIVAALRAVLDAEQPGQPVEAGIRLLLGRVLLWMDELEAGRAEVELAIPGLADDPREAARAMMLLGWPTDTTWPASRHRHWLHQAAQVIASIPRAEQVDLTVERASALLMMGDELGWEVAAELPAVDGLSLRDLGHVVKGYLNFANFAMLWGRHAEARRLLAQALELSKAHQHRRYSDGPVVVQAHLDWFEGNWDGLAVRAGALATEADFSMVRMEALLVTGLARAATGDRGAARQSLEHVLAAARDAGSVDAVMEPAAGLGRLALRDGRPEDALRITDEPVGVLVAKDIWIWAADLGPVRAEALALAGRIEELAELESMFSNGLSGRAAPAAQAALVQCRAILAAGRGDAAQAAALFAQAATGWRALPRPYNALLAAEGQARCLLAAGHQEAALPMLSEVLSGLSGLGARGDAVRVIETLKEHGMSARRPWVGGRRGYGDQISPRELDVVRLLVQGQTNRQIAQALALSPKTVARHLDSAMRKVGVSSRTALAVRVVGDGIVSGE